MRTDRGGDGLIITPQQVEYRFAMDVTNGADAPVHVLHSGVGPTATRSALTQLLEHTRPDRVLITGFCAGLDRSLETGDVLLAREVVPHPDLATPPDRVRTDDRGTDRLSERIDRSREGRLLTVPDPVFGRSEKRRLRTRWTEGPGLDTETAVAAHLLREHRVPFIAARVVLDTFRDDLRFVEPLIRDNPEPSVREVISYVLRYPPALVPLAGLARKFFIASRRLRDVVRVVPDVFRRSG